MIQREISAERIRKSFLLNISKKVGKIINIDSIAHTRIYILKKIDRSQRNILTVRLKACLFV
jgi:hypothetical protein